MPQYIVKVESPLELTVEADDKISAQKAALKKARELHTELQTWEAISAIATDEPD